MKRFALGVAALALLAATTVNAQIYQWKDESGKTVISDKPPVGSTRPQRTFESAPPASNPSAQKTLADRDMEFRKRQKEARESEEKARKEHVASANKKENCDNARRHLQALESGERIAMRDEKGERYFMEDGQRDQEAAKARQAVQSHCQ